MTERIQIALQVAIVVIVLAAAAYGIVSSASTPAPRIAVASVGPDASLIAETLRSPSPSPSPSPTATVAPTPTLATLPPQPSPSSARPPTLASYRSENPHCFCVGIVTTGGWTVTAPFDGRLEIQVYQLINGQLRQGTDAPGIPLYPYVVVTASDGRQIKYRPGPLDSDTKLIAQSSPVKAGDELFRIVGPAPSSWRDFYDRTVTAQAIVSLTSASGADLDPTALIRFK